MNQPNDSQTTIARLEAFAKERGLSKREIARRIGTPLKTVEKWLSSTRRRIPSPENLQKLNRILSSWESQENAPRKVWQEVREWWTTQHRYGNVDAFTSEVGWDTRSMRDCLEGRSTPPRLVVERVAEILSIPFPEKQLEAKKIEEKVLRIKTLLLILEEELRLFRDGPREAREIFRKMLDAFDVGYLSSLLVMLGEEDSFRRWLTLTTNRFNYFKKKGEQS
ncbi:MAG: helix-turn-helix transcriptional regulator [Ignavibacteria bacterium]|nr:helix-turn-helix transcriptional regulator [Ignavibacteria bacterium]